MPLSGLHHHVDPLAAPRCASPLRRASPAPARPLPCRAAAQARLDPVVVTGTREPAGARAAAAPTSSSSTPRRIRNSGADSVEDLLRRAAGVQIARNGGPGQNAGLSSSAARAPAAPWCWSTACASARRRSARPSSRRSSLAQIERIEVLRGPASSLYGADAVGGVVQIFTRRGEGAAARHRRGARSAATARAQARRRRRAARRRPFDYAVSLGREKQPRRVGAASRTTRFGSLQSRPRRLRARRRGTLRLGYAPAAGHRIGVNLLETRLNAQYDGAEFDRRPSTPIRRPTSATA